MFVRCLVQVEVASAPRSVLVLHLTLLNGLDDRTTNTRLTTSTTLAMGFLKRFFSLGSRKSTKRKEPRTAQSATQRRTGRREESWQHEQEGDVTRLLRSSSTHFNVVKEVDYTTLPPLREFQL